MILRDMGGTRSRHRLTWKMIVIGFYAGNVYDWVNAHGVGKVEFDSVGPDQLHDGIGAEPSLQELLGGLRKMEIVS